MKKVLYYISISSFKIVGYVTGAYFAIVTILYGFYSNKNDFPDVLFYIFCFLAGLYLGFVLAFRSLRYVNKKTSAKN